MRILGFYGKGGIGKSTVVSNLSVLFARAGSRVLQIGCDPKSDSCYSLVDGDVVTVMERWQQLGDSELDLSHCLLRGRESVDCLEVGGPAPGTGCGGRGITKALELVGEPGELRQRYDVVLFDVLGDVVCGGFSAPMRTDYADEIYIVTSGELRSLFAANNIAQAVRKHARNGVRLGGLVANLRGLDGELERVHRLAEAINAHVAHAVPHDPGVAAAELRRVPIVVDAPDAPAAVALGELHARIAQRDATAGTTPRPLTRADFDELLLTQ